MQRWMPLLTVSGAEMKINGKNNNKSVTEGAEKRGGCREKGILAHRYWKHKRGGPFWRAVGHHVLSTSLNNLTPPDQKFNKVKKKEKKMLPKMDMQRQ